MIVGEHMNARQVFEQLVDRAGWWRLLSSFRPKPQDVGQAVLSLPEDQRKILEQLKSDDIANLAFNDSTHPRPKE